MALREMAAIPSSRFSSSASSVGFALRLTEFGHGLERLGG
jgi:hypothetical protein